ncbi:MAG TPA: flagellar hook-length control protein FliK [Acidobacteriota bacterium]|nr:flagellar hook-length control protein FliK [Acidobacteriota bacterium]
MRIDIAPIFPTMSTNVAETQDDVEPGGFRAEIEEISQTLKDADAAPPFGKRESLRGSLGPENILGLLLGAALMSAQSPTVTEPASPESPDKKSGEEIPPSAAQPVAKAASDTAPAAVPEVVPFDCPDQVKEASIPSESYPQEDAKPALSSDAAIGGGSTPAIESDFTARQGLPSPVASLNKQSPMEMMASPYPEPAKQLPLEMPNSFLPEAAKRLPPEMVKSPPAETANELPFELSQSSPAGAAKQLSPEMPKSLPVEALNQKPVPTLALESTNISTLEDVRTLVAEVAGQPSPQSSRSNIVGAPRWLRLEAMPFEPLFLEAEKSSRDGDAMQAPKLPFDGVPVQGAKQEVRAAAELTDLPANVTKSSLPDTSLNSLAAKDAVVETALSIAQAAVLRPGNSTRADSDGDESPSVSTGPASSVPAPSLQSDSRGGETVESRNVVPPTAAPPSSERQLITPWPGKEQHFEADGEPGHSFRETLSQTREGGSQLLSGPMPTVGNGDSPLQVPAEVPGARHSEFFLQVAEKFQILVRNGSGEIRVQLKPENLGRLEINAEAGAHGVIARIATESESVKSYLEGNLSQLQQSFQDQGLKVERIDVMVQQGFDARNPGAQQHHTGQNGEGGGPASSFVSSSAALSSRGVQDEIQVDPLMLMYLRPNSTFHTTA